jgi:L-iditol 2-dehydrogenase
MKSVRIIGKSSAMVEDVLIPLAGGEFVVIKIFIAPMCTEYKYFLDGVHHQRFGHEAVGVVDQIAQSGKVKPGDRVVAMPRYGCGKCNLCLQGDYIYCQSNLDPLKATGNTAGQDTYAQYYLKQDWLTLPIPDDISNEHAAMACCGFGPTFGAVKRLFISPTDCVLITGLGPVGLGGVVNASYRGAKVFGVESNPYRARLALELGATAIFDPADPDILAKIMQATGKNGIDKAIECSGSTLAQRLMIDSLRPRGKAAFVGEGNEVSISVSKDLLRKGIELIGCWHYNLGDYPEILAVIRNNSQKIDRLITHKFPLNNIQEAFELQAKGSCGKVLLYPHNEII